MAEWLAVISITILAVISPGPDFAMVSRNSLVNSRRAGLLTAIGIAIGVLVHVAYTLIGIGILFQTTPVLFSLMKIAGACYLVWLGLQMLRAKPKSADGRSLASAMTDSQAFRIGFITNATNPKTMIFIVSLFMQIIEPSTSLATRIGYGLFTSGAHAVWFSMVAMFFASETVQSRFQRAKLWIDRGFGGLLIVFAVGLIALEHVA